MLQFLCCKYKRVRFTFKQISFHWNLIAHGSITIPKFPKTYLKNLEISQILP